jgi:hypothetical protein
MNNDAAISNIMGQTALPSIVAFLPQHRALILSHNTQYVFNHGQIDYRHDTEESLIGSLVQHRDGSPPPTANIPAWCVQKDRWRPSYQPPSYE